MFTRARVAAERRPLQSLDAPSQESQSGRRGVPRLAGPNVGLLNPDYHHPQLLELCELNQKRWESLTIPKPSPSGVWGLKKGAKRLGARRPGAVGSRRARLKRGILRSSITPTSTFDLRPPQKTNPQRSWGTVLPQLRGFGGFPEVRSPNEHAKSRGLD